MWEKIVFVSGGAATILGLIGIWIKIGIDKGQNDRRLNDVEKAADLNTADIKKLYAQMNEIKTKFSGLESKLSTDIEWIKDSLIKIEKKLDKE